MNTAIEIHNNPFGKLVVMTVCKIKNGEILMRKGHRSIIEIELDTKFLKSVYPLANITEIKEDGFYFDKPHKDSPWNRYEVSWE